MCVVIMFLVASFHVHLFFCSLSSTVRSVYSDISSLVVRIRFVISQTVHMKLGAEMKPIPTKCSTKGWHTSKVYQLDIANIRSASYCRIQIAMGMLNCIFGQKMRAFSLLRMLDAFFEWNGQNSIDAFFEWNGKIDRIFV